MFSLCLQALKAAVYGRLKEVQKGDGFFGAVAAAADEIDDVTPFSEEGRETIATVSVACQTQSCRRRTAGKPGCIAGATNEASSAGEGGDNNAAAGITTVDAPVFGTDAAAASREDDAAELEGEEEWALVASAEGTERTVSVRKGRSDAGEKKGQSVRLSTNRRVSKGNGPAFPKTPHPNDLALSFTSGACVVVCVLLFFPFNVVRCSLVPVCALLVHWLHYVVTVLLCYLLDTCR